MMFPPLQFKKSRQSWKAPGRISRDYFIYMTNILIITTAELRTNNLAITIIFARSSEKRFRIEYIL